MQQNVLISEEFQVPAKAGDMVHRAWLPGRSSRTGAGRGLTATLLRWAGMVLALWVAVFFGRSLVDTWLARVDYHRAVHPDRSVAETGVRLQVRSRLALVYRDRDGQRVRVLADQAAFSAFVRTSMAHLERARMDIQDGVSGRISVALEPTFTGIHGRVGDFADWYYAWSTSYKLMGKVVSAAAANAFRPSAMGLSEAVGYELEGYLHEHYQEIVLRPEVTEPRLRQAYRATLATLHSDYLDVMAALDERFQEFVAEQTTHLSEPLNSTDVRFTVDWESHRHKLSVAGHERGGLEAGRGIGLAAAGAVAGKGAGAAAAKKLAGLVSRGITTRMAAPYAGRLTTTAGGAAVGTLGGPVGFAVGGAVGLGVDYLVNEGVEFTGRDDLEAALHGGVAGTRVELEGVMAGSLTQAVQIWFDDSIQLLAAY